MKITETRIINHTDLYRLCNAKDWYTCGTNAEYELMFKKTARPMTTENLVELAKDIVEHTAKIRFADCEPNGTTPIQYVLFELAEICHSHFDIE